MSPGRLKRPPALLGQHCKTSARHRLGVIPGMEFKMVGGGWGMGDGGWGMGDGGWGMGDGGWGMDTGCKNNNLCSRVERPAVHRP